METYDLASGCGDPFILPASMTSLICKFPSFIKLATTNLEWSASFFQLLPALWYGCWEAPDRVVNSKLHLPSTNIWLNWKSTRTELETKHDEQVGSRKIEKPRGQEGRKGRRDKGETLLSGVEVLWYFFSRVAAFALYGFCRKYGKIQIRIDDIILWELKGQGQFVLLSIF